MPLKWHDTIELSNEEQRPWWDCVRVLNPHSFDELFAWPLGPPINALHETLLLYNLAYYYYYFIIIIITIIILYVLAHNLT